MNDLQNEKKTATMTLTYDQLKTIVLSFRLLPDLAPVELNIDYNTEFEFKKVNESITISYKKRDNTETVLHL